MLEVQIPVKYLYLYFSLLADIAGCCPKVLYFNGLDESLGLQPVTQGSL